MSGDRDNEEQLASQVRQVKLLQESNTNLRSSLEASAAKLAETERMVDSCRVKIQDLELISREMKSDLEAKQLTISSLEADNARWQARSEEVLNKFDSTDASQVDRLQTRVAELEQSQKDLESSAAKNSTALESALQRKNYLESVARKATTLGRELQAAGIAKDAEIANLQERAASLQTEFDNLKTATDQQIKDAKDEVARITLEHTELERNQQALSAQAAAANQTESQPDAGLQQKIAQLQAELEAKEATLSEAVAKQTDMQNQYASTTQRIQELEAASVSQFRVSSVPSTHSASRNYKLT